MRKTTVVRIGGTKLFDLINQNNTLLLMLLFVLIGIFIGSVSPKDTGTVAASFDKYLSARQNGSFLLIFLKSLYVWLPYVVAAFLCGTSLAGMATVPLVSAYFGYTYGVMAAYLYSSFSIQGIGFCMLLIIPSRVIACFAIMLACREAFAFSLMMAKLTLKTKGAAYTYINFKNYCLRYLFILLLLISSTLVDCLFFKGFGKFFSF